MDMKGYCVSLVLIVYNTELFLDECLDSIFAQTQEGLELVIVNSGSNVTTTELLEQRIKGKKDIVYLKTENGGGACAANLGLRHARGEYVFLMDSDDVLPRDSLKKLYTRATATDCDIVIGRPMSIINGALKYNRLKYDYITWAKELEVSDIHLAPHLTIAPFYWGRLHKRQFLLENDIFMKPGRINADRYFTNKALKYSRKTAVIHDICYFWRRHDNAVQSERSITQRKNDRLFFIDRMKSLSEVIELFSGDPQMQEYLYLTNIVRVLLPINSIIIDEEFKDLFLNVSANLKLDQFSAPC